MNGPRVRSLSCCRLTIVLTSVQPVHRLRTRHIVAFFLLVNYAICTLALIALRRREPTVARPFRAWGYPVTAVVFVTGTLGFLVLALVGDPRSALFAIGVLIVGLIVHAVVRAMR